MIKHLNLFKNLVWAAMLVLGLTQPAYAYVDPGSGAFVLQILGVFLASMLFFFRQFLYQLMERLRTLGDKFRGRRDEKMDASNLPD